MRIEQYHRHDGTKVTEHNRSIPGRVLREKYQRPEDTRRGFDFSRYTAEPKDDKVLYDYAGMNHYAGKAMGFPKMPKKKIYYDENYKGKELDKLLRHELWEAEDMRVNNKEYFPAHVPALEEEKKVD